MSNVGVYDVFAMVVWAVMLVAMAGTARLAFGEDPGTHRQWTNAAIVLGLMAAVYSLLLMGIRRVDLTAAMLVGVAFNLGYWRGSARVQASGAGPTSAA
jgi:tryptophan-rich sensory protein